MNAEQKQAIYPKFGLEWQWVRGAVLEAFTDSDRRQVMRQSTNIFRVLIKTLLKAGIITERTKSVYAAWVDMEELRGERDEVVGTDIADATVLELRDINAQKSKPISKALKRAG